MKISGVIAAIKSQYAQPPDRRRPLFVQGSPGIGKSDAPRQAAADLGIGFRSLQATIEDPITLSGLPARAVAYAPGIESAARWLDHAVFLPFADKLPLDGEGIIEIAEVNTAPPAVQAGLYDLFLHGQLGSYRLPPGWYVMATGNKDSDRAATQPIPMPLAGRWTRLEIEPDLADWTAWALAHEVRPEVIAYFQWKPANFYTFDPAKREPYCCPRTAVFASHILDSAPPGLEHEMICGTIGDGVGTEVIAFLRVYREMVSVDEILAHPERARLPELPEGNIAIVGALAHRATPQNYDRVMAYTRRLARECQTLMVRLSTTKDPALCATRAFIAWAADNADFVL